jgi:hypothetical protein
MKQSTRNDLVVKLLKMQIKDRQIEKLSRQSVIHYYIQFPIETFYFRCDLAEFRTSLKLRVQASFQRCAKKISANHVDLTEPPTSLPCINTESLNSKLSGTTA